LADVPNVTLGSPILAVGNRLNKNIASQQKFNRRVHYSAGVADRYGQMIGPDYLVSGRYRLRSKLGGGGMGAVWLAHDRLLDREVAIKQVATTAGMSERRANELREAVLREGRVAAKLSHKHAIAVYDVTLEAGEPWLVMEYLPSRSLAKALASMETLPPIEIAQIGAQVADALAHAHSAGIVHRDLKPGNILIADRGPDAGVAKVSDFGIAGAAGDPTHSEDGMITGTPAYLPPEVARGAQPSPASDVFSLGATLYTAVEGRPPFGIDADAEALVYRAARGAIIPPTRGGIMTDALLHMLEPSPARRPTMAQARDELAAAAVGAGGAAQIIGHPVRTSEGTIPAWAARSSSGRGAHRQPAAPYRTGPISTVYRTGPIPMPMPSESMQPLGSESLRRAGLPPRFSGQPGRRRIPQDGNPLEKAVAWLQLAIANPREHMVALAAIGVGAAIGFVALVTVIFVLAG
jgi:serine/threonine protein kinase